MTASLFDLALYAGGIFILFLTPGPVWVALIARAMSGGFASAFPLALGVVIGDILWPFLAIIGVSWVVGEVQGFMTVLRWVAVAVFWWMGIGLIRKGGEQIGKDSRLTAPGKIAGFMAGVAVILANPKAILFYMGVLPGFFDLRHLNGWDVAAICTISATVPLLGNSILSVLVHRARAVISSPSAIKRMNISSGVLLIIVGCIIPFT